AKDQYRVSLAFRRFATWQSFRDNVVTQKRILTRTYGRACYPNVLMFDFFMPLRNEEYLRTALDALFYKDTIKFRLKTIPQSHLEKHFTPKNEGQELHLERICDWIGERFVGYSISHVSGRFRVRELCTKQQVLDAAAKHSERYLVDETTAIVRFIFPCKGAQEATKDCAAGNLEVMDAFEKEADLIRWVFEKLFVQSVLEVVNGEDEIWLLESGMRSQLHIFQAAD
ncbi:unnamed protein product, partial [marine sediment metagenome]